MEKNVIDKERQKDLVSELVEGRDLTMQLYSANIGAPGLNVAQKILDKIESSLLILGYEPMIQSQHTTADSPHDSFSGSPKSPDSEGEVKDPTDNRDGSRKRKGLPRWTQKVQGCCSSGLEGPVEDGYNWRKYGQKDILGAKYPRSYYRCTQRSHGCFATKQVQRSDDDPTFFEVTYRGKHTCYQASSSSSYPNLTPKPEPSENPTIYPPHPHQSQEIIWSFNTDIKDINPIITTNSNNLRSPSFSFPSSSNPLVVTKQNPSAMLDSNNNLSTSTSTYESSPSLMINNFNDYHQSANFPGSGSESAFGPGEFDHDFIFDNQHFFQ